MEATQPMRVLMVTAHYFPHLGGVETHTYEVARRLAQRGVGTGVLTIDNTGHLPTTETIEGVAIRRVVGWPKDRDLYLAPAIAREIAHQRPDIIHVQGVHTLAAPLAMLAAGILKIPYVITFHTGGNKSRLRNALRGVQWRALRPLLGRAARMIGVSKFEAATFRDGLHLPPERFAVIHNGAQLPQLPETMPDQPAGPLIVSIGRLERYKGHHRVIAALPYLRAAYPEARLLILGSGPYEAALRKQAEQLGVSAQVEIRMIPPSERQVLAATVAQAAVVTLLSDYEAHPIAVMEALALERPVLVADTSGLRELADDGLARSVPLNARPAQVAAALADQIRNPLRPTNVTLPTWDSCTDNLLALYQTVDNESRRERALAAS
jgi:glycosyltransferase involved in cell wall biosynthesis